MARIVVVNGKTCMAKRCSCSYCIKNIQASSPHRGAPMQLRSLRAPVHVLTLIKTLAAKSTAVSQQPKGWKRERNREETTCGGGGALTVTLNPLVFTLNSHLHFNSPLSFTHLPTLFLRSWGRGRHHSLSVKMWKQPGGTGNQWVNKTADWVNNLEERPSRGSYVCVCVCVCVRVLLSSHNIRLKLDGQWHASTAIQVWKLRSKIKSFSCFDVTSLGP